MESLGICTYLGMYAAAKWTRTHPSLYLKRAAVFFDYVVVIPSGVGDMLPFENVLGTLIGCRDSIPNAVRKIFLRPEDIGIETEDACELLAQCSYKYWRAHQEDWEKVFDGITEVVSGGGGAPRSIQAIEAGKELYSINEDYVLPAVEFGPDFPLAPVMTEIHERVFGGIREAERKAGADAIVEALGEAVLPDWSNLSWEQIARAREPDYMDSFRSVVGRLQNTIDANPGAIALDEAKKTLVATALDLANEVEPSPMRAALVGAIGNCPSPIVVNPIGVASAVADVRKASKIKENYGWLFLLSGLRK